jgi:ABC-2 type transport system permease protein
MKKTIRVVRHELITTLSRRSYLLMSFGIPLIGILIFAIVSITKNGTSDSGAVAQDTAGSDELEVEGYVDQSGLISAIPQDIPSDLLVAYDDEDRAKSALEAGEITAYYIVPEDYVETGSLIYVHPSHTPSGSEGQDWVMRWTLMVNLLGGDAALAKQVWNPIDLEVTNLAPKPQYDRYAEEDCASPGPACESYILVRFIPFIMVVLFFIFISQGSSLLIRNISGEKQNQVIEVLMLSVDTRQLLTGKLIGLGIASLLPTMVWLGSAFIMVRMGGGVLNLPAEFTIPSSLLAWGVVFFILGYAVYASLMAGAGALVPNMKEITQASWVVLSPLFVGYFIGLMASGEAPHGALSTILSMFPLTAPMVMMMRLTVGGVPLWQTLLSAALMVLTALFVIRAVARMFRAQTLLSGQSFNVRRFANALLGR